MSQISRPRSGSPLTGPEQNQQLLLPDSFHLINPTQLESTHSMMASRPSTSPPKPWERAGGATAAPLALPTPAAAIPSAAIATLPTSTGVAGPALPARPDSMSTSGEWSIFGMDFEMMGMSADCFSCDGCLIAGAYGQGGVGGAVSCSSSHIRYSISAGSKGVSTGW